ncbi:hypothetical protein ILUMI_25892 [Ignelater luminosus]|uniref:Peptidase S1 domain-containing protein n=1 Tax=Ignelater luminosus TaxID=2038154 RepID=A0A8K0C4X5_IGNLU|nr:hypothetical protein ILUMI_25892 [Ignelater luminosus]
MFRLFILSALVATSLAAGIPPRVPMLDGRIVGGTPTTHDKHPHQLSLEWYNMHICGASIISSEWVVTAAHCTDGSSAATLSVRAGSSFQESGGEVRRVSRIIQHENYDAINIDFDIALLKLASPLSLGKSISLVAKEVATGTLVTVTGWGALSEGGSSPSQMREVSVNTITRDACKDAYGSSAITDRMICAGGEGGKDSCQGDSGGPLRVDGENWLAGVVSWGYGCARPRYPGVYSNVANLRGWIKQHSGV